MIIRTDHLEEDELDCLLKTDSSILKWIRRSEICFYYKGQALEEDTIIHNFLIFEKHRNSLKDYLYEQCSNISVAVFFIIKSRDSLCYYEVIENKETHITIKVIRDLESHTRDSAIPLYNI